MDLEDGPRDDVADENPFQADDLAAMTAMTGYLQRACNVELPGCQGRDINLILSVLNGHQGVPITICSDALPRVVARNDHFGTAVRKLLAAYPNTPEARSLQAVVNRVRVILRGSNDTRPFDPEFP